MDNKELQLLELIEKAEQENYIDFYDNDNYISITIESDLRDSDIVKEILQIIEQNAINIDYDLYAYYEMPKYFKYDFKIGYTSFDE